jgi:phage terminase large subunit-like protein
MVTFVPQRRGGVQPPPARAAALVWALTELVVRYQPRPATGIWLTRR